MGTNINEEKLIRALITRIEEMAGMKISTPKDFDRLRSVIYNRTGELISSTTLKRIWGYLDEPVVTRKSTWSILANFLGYKDWDNYCKLIETPRESDPSTPILGRQLNVVRDLKEGNRLKITWQPDRTCIAKYLGDARFEIVESEKTRLKPGDTFLCHFIISGHTLYLSDLRSDDREPVGYVCGRGDGGVRFEIL